MKKVVLLAIVLLISGLSFAQTKSPIKPFVDYKEDGYAVNEAVKFFYKNKNSVQAESLRETFLNIPAVKKYFPNLSVDDAIYFLSCSIKRMGHFEKGEYIIYGIQDGKVVICPERGSLADRVKGIAGDEPWILFDVTEVLRDSFKKIIPPTPLVPIVLARCLNTIESNATIVPVKPKPEAVTSQAIDNNIDVYVDTTIYNTVYVDQPMENTVNGSGYAGERIVYVQAPNNYYNNQQVDRLDPMYDDGSIRNVRAHYTANSYDPGINQNRGWGNCNGNNVRASAGVGFNFSARSNFVTSVVSPYGNNYVLVNGRSVSNNSNRSVRNTNNYTTMNNSSQQRRR
ncbi:MAG: hypothetical protein V4504_01595 [Patescibacteria group bacterium]